MSQTVPTDALLHGASFTTKPDAFEVKPRETMYAEGDDVRQYPIRPATGEELHQIASVKEIGQELIDLIDTMPMSREFALAKTKVEEAVMWAVKGITK